MLKKTKAEGKGKNDGDRLCYLTRSYGFQETRQKLDHVYFYELKVKN